jgi:8-oxo-dGTP diphosphatase
MRTRRVALIIFYDEEKRILLQDRAGISKFGEKWGYFGGEIEKGETPEEAVVRETKEELDFDLKDYEFIGIFKNQINEEVFVERHVFISPLKDNFSKFKQIEGERMELLSIEEAKNLKCVIGDDLILRKLEEIL